MSRFATFFALLVSVLFFSASVAADIPRESAGGDCFRHKHLLGGAYAYTEDFAHLPVMTGQVNLPDQQILTTIIEGCPGRNYVNFTNTVQTNVVLRAWVKLKPTTAPSNSVVTFRFYIDNIEVERFDRSLTTLLEAQGGELGVTYPNLAPGSHRIRLYAAFWPSGQIQVQEAFLIAQGSPTNFGAATTRTSGSMTIDGTWRQITNAVTFTATTDVHLLVDGNFRFLSGTPGQKVSVGFSLDGANSQRTIDLAVPPRFTHNVSVLDHYKDKPGYATVVPAGTHTISLWAVNRDGGTAAIDRRYAGVIGFTAADATTPIVETLLTSPVTVSTASDGTVPLAPIFTDCSGGWTNVMEISLPAVTIENTPGYLEQNIVGEGYLEFVTTSGGQPQPIDTVVQVLYNPTRSPGCDSLGCRNIVTGYESSTDFTMVRQIVPAGRSEKFFFTHPVLWGTDKENVVRILMRRLGCNYMGGSGTVTVGKRHMSLKAIPTTGATLLQYD